MRIPRTEEISLLFMSELALHYREESVSLSAIAERHGVSVLFLKKLARMLKQSGLIISKEGANGGYTLGKHPEEITVWDVLYAIDHTPNPHLSNTSVSCPLNMQCMPQTIYRTMNDALKQQFSGMTLQAMTKGQIL